MNARIPASVLNPADALTQVSAQWDSDIVRQLTDYIAIPAKSPGFDTDWAQHGYLETVLRNAAAWVEAQKVEGLTLEIVRLRRPHAGAVLRSRRPRGPRVDADRADVRPPRQATRVHRLAQRPRPLDAQVRRRQALRPRRRRRRLCGLCQHRGGAGAQGAERAAPAHRRPDRNLRGMRLLRPAALCRCAAPAPGRGRRW